MHGDQRKKRKEKKRSCIPETFPQCAISILYVHITLLCQCFCLLCFLFSFPSPHAVPKRALQRDKYGSQTKHCLSNVIDFGFTFFSLSADKGLMKQEEIAVALFHDKGPHRSNGAVKLSSNSAAHCSLRNSMFRSDLPLRCQPLPNISQSAFFPVHTEHTCLRKYPFFFFFALIVLVHLLKVSCQIFRRSDRADGLGLV